MQSNVRSTDKVHCERGIWLHLDETWSIDDRTFTDYGMITRQGNRFLDAALTILVAIYGDEPDSELTQALQQAEEHTLASLAMQMADSFSLSTVIRQSLSKVLLEPIIAAQNGSHRLQELFNSKSAASWASLDRSPFSSVIWPLMPSCLNCSTI